MKIKPKKSLGLKHFVFGRARRALGQHFLRNQYILRSVAVALNLKKGEMVIEIGPGLGSLTHFLLDAGIKLTAVEKDERLCGYLKEKFRNYKNFKLVSGDFLKYKFPAAKKSFKLVGNIPYNITGRILRKITHERQKPNIAVLMVQKEIGEKILARPPRATLLSNILSFFYRPEKVMNVIKTYFTPQPRVDSMVIKLTRHNANLRINTNAANRIIKILKIGFKQPRKTLLNNLSAVYPRVQVVKKIEKLNFSAKIRAENLSTEDWEKLATALRSA